MRINRDHPWLQGCKFFAFPDGTGRMRNLMGGSDGTVNNAPAFTRLGMHSALDMVQGSSQYTQFGTPASYGFAGPDITVLTRARPDALGSTNSETAFVSAAEAASAAGYLLLFSNFGGSEVGWCFAVYGGGTFLLASDGSGDATLGRSVVAAGRYESRLTEAAAFVNGKRGTPQASGGSWDVTPAGNIFLGKYLSPDIYADGAQAWVMIFDRALSDGEIARLSRDWEWPFLGDELGDLYLPDTNVTYYTVSGTRDAYTVLSPVTYATEVDALGSFGGDVVAEPEEPGPVTYSTVSRSSDQYIGGVPTLVFYTTVSSGTSTFTANSPVTYETLSYSSDRFVGLIDGRVDLVSTGRYRR